VLLPSLVVMATLVLRVPVIHAPCGPTPNTQCRTGTHGPLLYKGCADSSSPTPGLSANTCLPPVATDLTSRNRSSHTRPTRRARHSLVCSP
jgi:hypothetical protein